MKKSGLVLLLLLIGIAVGAGNSAVAAPVRPDLPQEYLATFARTDYVVQFREEAGYCEVYDGRTGKFLFIEDVPGMTLEEAAAAVNARARQLGV